MPCYWRLLLLVYRQVTVIDKLQVSQFSFIELFFKSHSLLVCKRERETNRSQLAAALFLLKNRMQTGCNVMQDSRELKGPCKGKEGN